MLVLYHLLRDFATEKDLIPLWHQQKLLGIPVLNAAPAHDYPLRSFRNLDSVVVFCTERVGYDWSVAERVGDNRKTRFLFFKKFAKLVKTDSEKIKHHKQGETYRR